MTEESRITKRRWIKMYPIECINGSIRHQLTSAQRGVWYDLLNFSALCSNTGDICDRDGNPFPLTYIANRLNITLTLLNRTIQECVEEGRLIEDDNGLHIKNWNRYQSEYDRQKPYRQAQREEQRRKDTETVARLHREEKDAGHPLPRTKEEHEAIFRHATGDKLIDETEDGFLIEEPDPNNPLAVPPEVSDKLNARIEETKAKIEKGERNKPIG